MLGRQVAGVGVALLSFGLQIGINKSRDMQGIMYSGFSIIILHAHT